MDNIQVGQRVLVKLFGCEGTVQHVWPLSESCYVHLDEVQISTRYFTERGALDGPEPEYRYHGGWFHVAELTAV